MGLPAQTVPLGGQQVAVPRLLGPVGAPNPAFANINQRPAVDQVDAELATIAKLRNKPGGTGGVTAQLLAMANAVQGYAQDRPAAIAGFQNTANVGTAIERTQRVILPDGLTWRALFSYAKMSDQLEILRDRSADPRDYVYTGRFDHALFSTGATTGLRADLQTSGKFNPASLPDYDRMLTFMENDVRIIDVRWMAYMFATAFFEGAETVVVGRRTGGKPIKQWRTVVPISETGEGETRRYARPVKVEALGPTRARITEWDGDQFEVTEEGYTIPRGMDGGARYDAPASVGYTKAKGVEHVYFGRGYVQLTWWYNYAAAGVAIGRGFDLLNNPELAKDADTAYKVMADGMITGRHYANRRRIQNYIYGAAANYAGARAIVNAADPEPTIVQAALAFEAALLAARL